MIKLDVNGYCENCEEFRPEMTQCTGTSVAGTVTVETVIKCRYANRCENIEKYMRGQSEETEKSENDDEDSERPLDTMFKESIEAFDKWLLGIVKK